MSINLKYGFLLYGKIAFVLSFMLFSSCSSSVKNFDDRLHKKYEKKGFESAILAVDDHKIFYYDNQKETQKPAILFIHGFGGDGKVSWFKQVKDFYEDYRVIVPDLLWFGNSYSSAQPTLMSQIGAMNTLLQELNVDKVHVVGISYGGFIALGMAKEYPELLSSLVIVNSPGAVIKDEEIDRFCRDVGVRDVKEAFIPKDAAGVKRLLDFSFYKKPLIPSRLLDQVLETYFSKHPEQQAQLLDELPSNRGRMSGGIDVPAKIIWGIEDEIFHVYDAYALKKEIGAELKVIKKAGHALPGEQPKAFNEALRVFIDGIN